MEYFTKFELKAATAGYHQLDNVLIDLLKNQVQHKICTKLCRGGIPIPTDYAEVKQRLYNMETALEEEKLRNHAFHTGAPIPPQ